MLSVHGTALSVDNTGLLTFVSGQTFPGAGTVTSVGSGAGLTGGPITTSGTLSIANGGVTNTMLAHPSLTVGAGTGLSGGGSVSLGGSTTLSLASKACASGNALSALPFTCSPFATLGVNTFTGNQTVNGYLTATSGISGLSSTVGAYGVYGYNSATSGGEQMVYLGALQARKAVAWLVWSSQATADLVFTERVRAQLGLACSDKRASA